MTIYYKGKVRRGRGFLDFRIPKQVRERGVVEIEFRPTKLPYPKLDHIVKRMQAEGEGYDYVRVYGPDINNDQDCRETNITWEDTPTFIRSRERR